MSPTNQMEQEEEFKNAMSVLKDLESQVLNDTALAKEQADMIKTIEVEIDKCIQSLIARREVLIKEVTSKFKSKRDLMEAQQKQIAVLIEGCKKMLDTGTTVYAVTPEVSKESWKLASKLRIATPKNAGRFEIKFQPLNEIEKYGTVIEESSTLEPVQQPVVGGLISQEGQRSIAAWLPNKTFNLLYRASRDGFKSSDFHRMCDNKGPTLTIIRSHPHNYLFGGYTPQSWDGNGAKKAANAFIFTLTNPHGIPPTKYSYAYYSSTYCGEAYGPIFGAGTGNDVIVAQIQRMRAIQGSIFRVATQIQLARL